MTLPFAEAPLKLTVAWAFPAVALTVVGAIGGPAGVTLFDADDARDVPTLLVAVTVNVYAVPLVKPLTVIGLTVLVPVNPPGEEVTM